MSQILTAAPVIQRPRAAMPAPAFTDFVNIVIAAELNDSEANVAIRHEQAHIWCEHNNRRGERVHELWQIACELEIARNIYTPEDRSVIERPRSRLAGGYLPDTIEELPFDINLAEEIYDWLKKNPDKIPEGEKMCSCDHGSGDDIGGTEESPAELVEKAKEKLDSSAQQKQLQENLSSKLSTIKYKQPSLTDELDAMLRHRVVRERSWRRPTRRLIDSGVMTRGSYSSRKRPLIEIFVDRSGSFDAIKTANAQTVLKKILAKYNVQLKADVFFFGNDRLTEADFSGGGNTPYHLIVDHLNNTRPKIALVITDDDSAGPFNLNAPKDTEILCLPVGASTTKFSAAAGGRDVTY